MTTTSIDPYKVLGIPPDADLDTIKRAYRCLAMQFHPDRGGSHEKMLAINEAFYLLTDPAGRAKYERGAANRFDPQAQHDAEEAIRAAAQHASSYPPRSEDIDDWMDSVTRDFLSASYGKTQWGATTMPTIENSTSGALFLFVGGILGAIAGGVIEFGYLRIRHGPSALSLILICASGGAWVAQFFHRGIRTAIGATPAGASPNQASEAPQFIEQAYVACPSCGQRLRYSSNPGARTLRCPRCSQEFSVGARNADHGAPGDTAQPAHARASSGVGWGVGAAIIAAVFLHTACTKTYPGGFLDGPTTETNWVAVLVGTGICFFTAKALAKRT